MSRTKTPTAAPETAPELQTFRTPDEAATFIPGASAYWLKIKARHGEIPHQRVTGQRRIAFSDADIAWIQQSMAEPALSQIQPKRAHP